MSRGHLVLALAALACDPRLMAKDDPKKDAEKEQPASEPSHDDSPGPFSALGALGALGKAHEPGPFEEPSHSPGLTGHSPHAVILRLDGDVDELDHPFELSLSMLSRRDSVTLRSLTQRLDKLDADNEVNAVLIRFGAPRMSLAVAEELRDALAKRKKPVACHFEAANNIGVLLASACKTVAMAPAGEVVLNGPAMSPIYLKGLLDLLGVDADFIHVGAFKGAAEPFTRSEPSPEMRQTYADLIDGAFTRMTQLIAAGRHVEPAKVAAWIDQALFDANQAKSAGIVDDVVTYQAWRDGHGPWKREKIVEKKGGMDDLFAMLGLKPHQRPSGPRLALIYATGEVVDGPGSPTGTFTEIASGRLAPALYQAADDDAIKAIVLRVDSPGGSALAADVIWQAVHVAAARKPVVVSMGNLAASGGYYISSGALRIFAQPDTLTGSIGVIGGKLVFAPALAKVGVTSVELGRGKRAHIMSPMHHWSDDERKALDDTMESVYLTFKARVAEGRHVSPAAVEPNAQGRVFTGAEALKRGLVDELGGLDDAVAYARQAVKLGDDSPIEVYPREPSLLEMLGGFGEVRAQLKLALPQLASASIAGLAGPEAAAEIESALRLLSHFAGEPVRVVTFVPAIR